MRRWLGIAMLLLPALPADGQDSEDIRFAMQKLKSERAVERAGAARDLGRWKVARAVRPMIAAYPGADEMFKAAIVEGLEKMGPIAFKHVFGLLTHKDLGLRHAAAGLIEKYSAELSSLPISGGRFVAALQVDDEVVRRVIRKVAASIGGKSTHDALFKLLFDSDARVRRDAATILARSGSVPVPRLLATVEQQESAHARHGAMLVLGGMRPVPSTALPVIRKARSDPDAHLRAAAVEALGHARTQQKETVALLIDSLADPAELVWNAAIVALAEWGADAIPPLVRALEDRDRGLRAARALKGYGQRATGPLIRGMDSQNPRARAAAAFGLALLAEEHPEPAAFAALRKGLTDPGDDVRAACASGLGGNRDYAGRAEAGLTKATRDKFARVRAEALRALTGHLKGKAVEAAVRRGLDDPDTEVAMVAGYAVFRVGGDRAKGMRALRAALIDREAPVDIRVRAANLFAKLGSAAEPVIDNLIGVAKRGSEPTGLRVATVSALGVIVGRRGAGLHGRTQRFKKLLPGVRLAVDRGLNWLADAQSLRATGGDGRWDCDGPEDGGWPQFDVGVTALSLLAFLAAGYTDRDPGDNPYAATVREGLAYLASCRDGTGLFLGPSRLHQHYLLEHALATQVFVEWADMTGDDRHREATQRGLDLCAASRTPGLGWGYQPRDPKNNTDMTTWLLTTLRFGDLAGYRVDRGAYAGAIAWIDKMTSPYFGQTGYDDRGGAPFRDGRVFDRFPPEKTQSPSAAGLWCRSLAGHDIRSARIARKGTNLCLGQLPIWNEDDGSIDLYYWYYGSLALEQIGGAKRKQWFEALHLALLPSQQKDGSWAPKGAWGLQGGRIYTTAIATLTLLTPARYAEGFADPRRMQRPYRNAVRALRAASKSGGAVGDAATAALAGVFG